MKDSALSGILLIAIISYLIVPAIPIVDYLINKDFIAKNLCENRNKPKSCCKGKCYLLKQLKKANHTATNEPKNTQGKFQLKELNEFILCTKKIQNTEVSIFKYLITNQTANNQILLFRIYAPPELVSI